MFQGPVDDNLCLIRNLDSDDDFFHVTCHVDKNLKQKIRNGEYVDLEKLLPLDKSVNGQSMGDGGEVMQLVTRGGATYFAPACDKESKINGIHKWDQAFRVYAAVYSEANPHRVGRCGSTSM